MFSRIFSRSHPFVAFVVVLLIFVSCRTTEKVADIRLRPMSATRLYRKALDNTFDYKRFSIKRINIQMENETSKASFRASISAIKDTAVLITITKLNILVAKVMLMPDSITYVNFLDKSYYAGNYEPFRQMLNFDLSFDNFQAIISANIFTLFEKQRELREFETWIDGNRYVLQSETVRKLSILEDKGKYQRVDKILKRLDEDLHVVQTFYFDPRLFVIRKLALSDKTSGRQADLDFDDYEPVGDKYYPASMSLTFSSEGKKIRLDSKLSGFSTDGGEFVPLRIPEKYQRVYLN